MLFTSPKLSDFFRNSYIPRRLVTASPKTIRVYEVTLRHFERFLGKPARLKHLTDETLAEFQQFRLSVDGVTRGTVKRDSDVLLALWRLSLALGKVKYGPTIKPISCPTPPPIAWTQAQMQAIWEASQSPNLPSVAISCDPPLHVASNIWWPPVMLVFFDSAERFTACFELRESDLDWDSGKVTFRAETRKGGREHNVQQLQPTTLDYIERLLSHYPKRNGSTRLFRWATNRCTLFPRFGQICEMAGVPNPVGKKFHTIRSTVATQTLIAGGDATAKLRHSSDAVTRKHYIDPRQVAANEVVVFRPGQVG